jgi:hypothetical protein
MVFGLAGILIFVVAFGLAEVGEHAQMWADIIKDFGVVIMALAVTDIVWKFVGGDPVTGELTQLRSEISEQVGWLRRSNELSRSADESGLVAMAATPALGVDWKLLFTLSTQNIDLMALTLLELIDNQEMLAALEDAVKRGVLVRILLYDPKNNKMEFLAENKDATNSLIEMALNKLGEMGRRVQAQKDVKVTFRIRLLRARALQVAVRRFDESIYVMHYLQSQTSPKTPVFAVEGMKTPLFKVYSEEFDWLFERAADYDWSVPPLP